MIGQGRRETGDIGSVRMLRPCAGAGYAAYCASKGGLATVQASWRRVGAAQDNVNVVAPTSSGSTGGGHAFRRRNFYTAWWPRIPLDGLPSQTTEERVLFLVSPARIHHRADDLPHAESPPPSSDSHWRNSESRRSGEIGLPPEPLPFKQFPKIGH